jgi:hypothetical protein
LTDAELAKDPVSALGLVQLYESNEIGAERSSKGFRFVYQGRVDAVGRDVAGRPYLTMGRSEKGSALQCMFKASDEAQLAQLSRGQQVYVQGVIQRKAINVIMDDSRILDSTFIGADEVLRALKKAGINPRDLDSHTFEVAKRNPDLTIASIALMAARSPSDVLYTGKLPEGFHFMALIERPSGKVTTFRFDPGTKTMVQENAAHGSLANDALPDWVPIYPGLSPPQPLPVQNAGGRTEVISYTEDPPAKIVEYYQTTLGQAGFTIHVYDRSSNTWVMHTKSTPRDDSAWLVAGRQ